MPGAWALHTWSAGGPTTSPYQTGPLRAEPRHRCSVLGPFATGRSDPQEDDVFSASVIQTENCFHFRP